MANNNTLMFQVGVQEVDNQLKKLEERLKKITTDYQKITIRVQVENIEALTNAISKLGSGKEIDSLRERLDNVKRTVQSTGEAAKKAANDEADATEKAAKSMLRYQKLLNDSESILARISNISARGESLRIDTSALNTAKSDIDSFVRQLSKLSDTEKTNEKTISALFQLFSVLKSAYKDVITEANRFNNATEKNLSLQKKVEEESRKTFSNLGKRQNDPGLQTISATLDSIMQKLVKTREDIDLFRHAIGSGNKESIDFGQKGLREAEAEAERLMRQYAALYETMERLSAGGNERPLLSFIQSNKELEMLNESFRRGTSELQKQAKAEDEALKLKAKAEKEAEKQATELAKAQERLANSARKTAENLGSHIDKLNAKKINFKGMDFSELDAAIAKIRAIQTELQNFARTGRSGYGSTSNEIIRNMGLATANEEAAIAVRHLTAGKRDAERATNQLSESEQRLANAIKGTTSSMRSQSQILGDLKSLATQYLGVWGAQGFFRNVVEIGGQLEQQRLSIGAILGDMAAGQHLFDQIKELALTSPFGVMELDKNTKQLSAYGFKQSELFDMTKRLADISAGAGTEVSRLALALGHVRSEGALTGYTLRQFAMNNIPMLQKLSERLTKIEGQIVSTSEIRKRVSKKEIGYEDVIAVIKDLTNESGMFYKMQETMSEAVNAKFKNLKDSFDIMYGEMAEGKIGSVLKTIAETLMYLSRNWEETARVMGYASAAFIAYRVAMTSANTQMLTYGNSVNMTTSALNAKAVSLGVNTAAVKRLSAAEVDDMVALKLLTREQLLNAVATKTLTVDQAELAAATFNVSRSELMAIASKGRLGMATAGLSLRIRGLMLSLRGVGMALKTLFLNPIGITMLAITGVVEMLMRWKQRNEEIEKGIEELGRKGTEGYKNLSATIEKYSGKDTKMSESEYVTAIADITDALKNYAPNITNILKEAQAIEDLAGRYKYLRDELESTKNAYADLERTKSFSSNANEATGNMLNDTFTENVKDYIGDIKKVDKAEQELMQHRVALEKTLDEFEKKYAFKRRTDKEGNVLPLIEQIKYIRSTDWNRVFAPMLNSNSFGASSALNEFYISMRNMEERMRSEVLPDLQEFANRLNNQYAGTFGVNWKENADHVKTAWMAVVAELDRVPGMTDAVKKEMLEKIFNEQWKLNIDFSTGEVEEKLAGWRAEMQQFFDENGISIRIGVNDSVEDIEKKLKGIRDDAQSEVDRYGKVLIGIGFKLDNLPGELPAPLATQWNQNALDKYPAAKNTIDAVNKAVKEYNFNLGGKTKTKGGGKSEDKNAKAVREQVRVIKEAADAFQYWREKVGDKGAWAHVQSEFGDVLSKIGITADNIEDVRKHLNNIQNTKEFKAIKDQKLKTEIEKEIAKDNDAFIRKDFEKTSEEWASSLNNDIDILTRKWETFNSVVSETGDRMLAARLSGISPGATPADLKRANLLSFSGARIDFDSVLGMSDKEIDEYVYSLGAAEEKIKAIQNGLKDWKKAQEDVLKSDIENYAKWLGSLVDLESVRLRNQEEYNRLLEETNRLLAQGVITQEEAERRKSAAETNRNSKNFQATTMYASLYNNSLAMADGSFYEAFNKETARLFDLMRSGNMPMSEYADKIEKLNKIAAEFEMQGFLGIKGGAGAYLSGGYQGLIDYHWNRAKEKRANGDEEGANEEEETAKSMMKAQKAADQLLKAFQDLSTGADMLANLFDALGMEGAANAFGDAAGVLGGAASGASSLSAFGPWGMAAGAVLGGLTSIAQLHDNSIQREIDAIQDEVDALEENTRSIKSFRERTLGYDSGDLRRQYAAQYKSQLKTVDLKGLFGNVTIDLNPAATAMYKYYSQGGENGNGYQQELNNLKQQREDYIKMYDLEEEKKKSSNEALNEYKQKIAELDEQIAYFAEDLSNELFGIDLKGWADEIGDALMTAFENGEDAAEAFNDTVQDIMRQVLRKMLSIGIIEPMMERLRKRLFGENGQGGLFSATNPEGTIDAAMQEVASFFGEGGEGRQMIEAAETFYKRWQSVMESQGLTLDSGETSSKASSSIKSITEQTADLLASLVNATRADVSVNRAMIAQYFPMYYAALTNGSASLRNIEQHTAAIMRSNDAIASSVSDLQADIRGLKNKTWRMPVS